MTTRPAAIQEDRAHALRRTALGVLVALAWIVVVGVFWRQAATSATPATLVSVGSVSATGPSTIEVEPGATPTELRELFEAHGITGAERAIELSLVSLLAPGQYDLSPTTDARSLLKAMADAFVNQVDAELLSAIERQGRSLVDVLRVAALSEQVAQSRSELPVVAGVLWNRSTVALAATQVVSNDALAAAVFPATTDARDFHRDASGDLRVDNLEAETLVDTDDAALLQTLAERSFQTTEGRASVVVVGPEVTPALGLHPHRYVEIASVYKLAVLAVAVDEVQQDRLKLDAPLVSQLPTASAQGSLSESLTLRDALTLMITVSDNATAQALLTGLTPDAINQRLRRWGVVEFSVGSKPQVASAHGVARLLDQIVRGPQFSAESRSFMMDLLYRTDQGARLAAFIDAPVAHKTGDLGSVVNDAGILASSGGPLIVVALIDEVEVRARADQAISRLAFLTDNWFGPYLKAEAAVRRGDLRGCRYEATDNEGPLDGARIALDPGHGGQDPGAQVTLADGDELNEADVVLTEAELIRDRLVDAGATVFLTRCDDHFLGITERSALINAFSPDIAISLHIDGSESSDVDSSSVLYFDENDVALAEAILGTEERPGLWDALNRDLELSNGGVIRRTTGPLPFVGFPAVLTEPVVLTHPAEAEALAARAIVGSARLKIIVDAHVRGIIRYWGEQQ